MLRSEEVFRALADPNRPPDPRPAQGRLAQRRRDRRRISDLDGLSSHHYGVLKAADLIRSERRGQRIVYSLNTSVFEDVASALADLFRVERPDGGVA